MLSVQMEVPFNPDTALFGTRGLPQPLSSLYTVHHMPLATKCWQHATRCTLFLRVSAAAKMAAAIAVTDTCCRGCYSDDIRLRLDRIRSKHSCLAIILQLLLLYQRHWLVGAC